MSGCRFPEHHGTKGGDGPGLFVIVSVIAAAVVLVIAVRFVMAHLWWFAVPPAVLAAVVLAVAVIRFARLDRAAKRHWLRARWHRITWKRLARNLDLGRRDKHLGGIDSRRAPKNNHPKARFRPDSHGWVVTARTVPGVGRQEFEAAAEHLRNKWGAVRVGVTQDRPGRVKIRSMIRDPLTEPLSPDVLPARWDGRHLVLGHDEWGDRREVDLANLSGSVISGNPGRGKTESATSMAVQLVPSPMVDLHILDGGACDWAPFAPAAASYVDDNLTDAEELVLELHSQMMKRRRNLEADLGTRNAWSRGPNPDYRFQWLLMEEAPWYLDLDSARGDRVREAKVRAIRGMVVQLLRRGRAPMFHTTLVCQKATGSGGCPPDIRDLAGLRWCFGVATTEVAVGGLGDDIRQYETLSPTLLQGPEHVGVATVLLKTGLMPYTMVKFPAIGEDLANRVAREAAQRRAVVVPDDISSLASAP
jgi:DNA segregation ATPase FtsK/SpoIIIE, S-DNA-T family